MQLSSESKPIFSAMSLTSKNVLFRCECGHIYPDMPALESHWQVHRNICLHQCHVCARSFSWRSSLERHKKIHAKKRPIYTCVECIAWFETARNLDLHKQYHSGKNIYKCNECDMAFDCSSRFTKHELKHAKHSSSKLTCATPEEYIEHSRQMAKQNNVEGDIHSFNDKPYGCETKVVGNDPILGRPYCESNDQVKATAQGRQETESDAVILIPSDSEETEDSISSNKVTVWNWKVGNTLVKQNSRETPSNLAPLSPPNSSEESGESVSSNSGTPGKLYTPLILSKQMKEQQEINSDAPTPYIFKINKSVITLKESPLETQNSSPHFETSGEYTCVRTEENGVKKKKVPTATLR